MSSPPDLLQRPPAEQPGALLRWLRRRHRLSGRELSERTGVGLRTIYAYELGKKPADAQFGHLIETLEKLDLPEGLQAWAALRWRAPGKAQRNARIIELYKLGVSQREIAAEFYISKQRVQQIVAAVRATTPGVLDE